MGLTKYYKNIQAATQDLIEAIYNEKQDLPAMTAVDAQQIDKSTSCSLAGYLSMLCLENWREGEWLVVPAKYLIV